MNSKSDYAPGLQNGTDGYGQGICSNIWLSATKVCCDGPNLNKSFQYLMNNTSNIWKGYVTSLVNLRNLIPQIQSYYASTSDLTSKLTSMMASPNYNFSGLTLGQVLSIMQGVYTFESELKKFRTEGATCFNASMQTRSVTMCYGCVLGSNTFFRSGPNGEPSPTYKNTTCKYLLSRCYNSWRFMFQSNLLYFIAQNINKHVTESSVTIPPPNLYFQLNSSANSTTPLGDVQNLFQQCPTFTDPSCTPAIQSSICSAIFNFLASEQVTSFGQDLNSVEAKSQALTGSAAYTYGNYTLDDAKGMDLALVIDIPGPILTQAQNVSFWLAGGIQSSRLLTFTGTALFGLIVLLVSSF